MYACSRKLRPEPPYSGGKCGAQSPASFTLLLMASAVLFDAARSSGVAPCRQPAPRMRSFGRISLLTMRAVRSRIALMRGSNVGTGFTFIGIAPPSRLSATLAGCPGLAGRARIDIDRAQVRPMGRNLMRRADEPPVG